MPAGFWNPATRREAATNDRGYYTPYTPYHTPYAFISDCTAFHGESEKELIYKAKQAFAFTLFYGKSCGFDNSNLSISATKGPESNMICSVRVLFLLNTTNNIPIILRIFMRDCLLAS